MKSSVLGSVDVVDDMAGSVLSGHHNRRHSMAMTTSIASLTAPYTRSRSHSTSSVPLCPPSLAAHLLASVNSTIKEMEDADTTGFLKYVDDQVHETWDSAKAVMVGAQRLLRFHELPQERQENQYVLTGPVARMRYMVFTGFVGSIGIVTPFFKFWDTKPYRPLRISVFLAMAFSSIVPVLHLVSLKGALLTLAFLKFAGVSVTMYLLGVVFCK
ncbi:hypothetical protein EC973_006508 [Apophysomyces ossiformis]|uniref:Uncharacterized protein n=1 Tax=Apophysomyces ossiformis TaxID=679940 RepID=A0A8H7ERM3_9FUNG|nr:hypothetical protein EC973_006508 [Apophysomyces ossiformis]